MTIKTAEQAIEWLKTVKHFSCGEVIKIIKEGELREASLKEDLDSEKILSKTLLGQRELFRTQADERRFELKEFKAREAVLRDELETSRTAFKEELDGVKYTRRKFRQERDALQQRLTVAEQRAGEQEAFLQELKKLENQQDWSGISAKLNLACSELSPLKPAAEPAHVCDGCGLKGWTANCAQCVPY